MTVKLLFLSGSCRKDSFNKKLSKIACDIASKQGIEATFIDLADFDMPIYNGDLEDESGVPENAIKLKKIFIEHDGFFIASPEYNSSFSSLLKNTLDWISREHEENEPSLAAYRGKVAAISSTSPGGLGGMRGLVPLRMLLGNIGVTVIPDQLAIPAAHNCFNDKGQLTDDKQAKALQNVISSFVKTTKAIKG